MYETRNDGLYHVPAEDWDGEALLCVLQVLHLHNSQVPRTVSLEMLAKIAVLVDFYKCADTAGPYNLSILSPVVYHKQTNYHYKTIEAPV